LSHHRHRFLLVLLCSPALWLTNARAAIPSSVKQSTSPTVLESGVRPFITGEIARLKNKSTQKMGKDALIAECVGSGDVTATPEYQIAYARELNRQLTPLLKDSAIRVRLAAAIVAAEVAFKTDKTDAPAEFDSLAKTLMTDKENAIQLWGVKLAKYVIADLAQQGKDIKAIDKAVLAVVKDHPDRGYFAEEAYAGLTLEPLDTKSEGFAKATPAVLPDLLNLMTERTAQYATAVPGSPQAEEKATIFLAVNAQSAVSAPAVRNRVLQVLGEAACAVLTQIANGNNANELVSVARAEGGALNVFGQNFGNPALSAAGQAISSVSPSTPSNTLNANCTSLAGALKGMGVNLQNGGAPPGPGSGTDSGARSVVSQSSGDAAK
jgi:hypothetical protein